MSKGGGNQQRTAILKKNHRRFDVEVVEFSRSHLRLIGRNRTVDYWPSTGRAWEKDSCSRARLMEPLAALEFAAGSSETTLDREYRKIMA
jgi:hypothetical protein